MRTSARRWWPGSGRGRPGRDERCGRTGLASRTYWRRRSDLLYYRYIDYFLRCTGVRAQSLIDVGSGNCPYLEWWDGIPERVSVDIRTPCSSDRVRGITGDIHALEFPARFDICTCLQVLEHVPEAGAFARRLLALPYLQPAQAQKHVTHNEALRLLDALVQCRLSESGAETPPADPAEVALYALGPAPTGAWAGQGGMLAQRAGGGWIFVAPQPGWLAWDLGTGEPRVHDGSAWRPALQDLPGLGIGAQPDAVNRLAVAAAASLFSHAGAGHQIKVNKAAAGDTAALLFQSDWTGHAEIVLAGETAFSVKVSAAGSAWDTVLRIDPATQQVTLAPAGSVRLTLGEAGLALDVPLTGTAVQQSADDVTAGRLMLAQHGVLRSAIAGPVSQSGGVPTGAIVESGSNANGKYLRHADSSQICWSNSVVDETVTAGQTVSGSWTYPAAFAGSCTVWSNLRSLGTESYIRIAAESLRSAASPGTGTAYYALHNAAASDVPTARLDLCAVGRWY